MKDLSSMDVATLARERQAVEHASKCYAVLSRHLPATTTLAELIVLSEVAKGAYWSNPVSVSDIVRVSGLSRWAVSRIIIRYLETGGLVETKDPNDSRKNLLAWTSETFELSGKWAKDWLEVM